MIHLHFSRWRKLLIALAIIGFLFAVCQILPSENNGKPHLETLESASDVPLIIWWTPLVEGGYESRRICDLSNICRFTTKRDKLGDAGAILFYGSNVKTDDFPLPRLPHHIWALIHEESPRNVPFMPYNDWLQHFNFTSTFSRNSNVPLTTFYLTNVENLTCPTYTIPIGEKSRYKDHALVLFIQSDCDTMSGRDDYVKELMNYIKVDSFGTCLKNRNLPDRLQKLQHDYLNNLYAPELLKFIGRYKFVISYENGVCEDYITEKFWRPLIAGSIPIYYGSPSIKDWSPNEKSFIDVRDFKSPESLAMYLKELDADDRAYNSYLNHKYNMLQPITNKRLLNDLNMRKTAMHNGDLFQSFECAVCSHVHDLKKGKSESLMASERHYQCAHDPVYPSMYAKVSNYDDWYSIMNIGKCKARILDTLFRRNKNYTNEDFTNILNKELSLGKC
ncbi:alpha-(1,3)-fucosyltransferase B-like isoform X1 [Musca domestica]|uniref:Fucosyltransferase n=1 Tax=Musca domestica TaxID=7370 RepID=A0ABM3VEP3_MUSDO|nr:alpha-(1,3)-fucosyltransferase B-like isoform X1 [Musca domestica]